MTLACVSMAPWWTETTWRQWCRCLKTGVGARCTLKGDLPLRKQREQQRALVHGVMLKRPAAASQPRKRTPFTRKREGSLVQAGVRRSIYKAAKPSGIVKRPALSSRLKR